MTEGDDGRRAFEALYRDLYPIVVRTVYLVVLDTDVAQEICHEAFLRRWQHRNRLGEHANERAWLMRVAINLAIDHRRSFLAALRHRGSGPPVVDPATAALAQIDHRRSLFTALRHPGSVASSPDPATTALAHIEHEAMRRALVRLRKRDRALLALRFEQDLSFPEIGMIFGRPEATVKTWVHRALDQLQRELGGPQMSPVAEES